MKSASPTIKSTKRIKQKVPKIQVIPPPPPELDFMLPPVCLETELPRYPQRAYTPPGPPMHYRRVERGRSHGLLGRYDEPVRVDPWW
jgi:hypothetical protein